jgi:hypothetical protein
MTFSGICVGSDRKKKLVSCFLNSNKVSLLYTTVHLSVFTKKCIHFCAVFVFIPSDSSASAEYAIRRFTAMLDNEIKLQRSAGLSPRVLLRM